MKKIVLSIIIALTFIISACSKKAPDQPEQDAVKNDIQEYIAGVRDENAVIKYFTVESDNTETKGQYTAACIVSYQSDEAKYVDRFQVIYSVKDGGWVLKSISIDDTYSEKSQESLKADVVSEQEKPTQEESVQENATDNAETASTGVTGKPALDSVSDNLFDFTFMLDGVVYQLPFAFTQLTDAGWTISSTGVSMDELIYAWTIEEINIAKNGMKVAVYIINPTGNTLPVRECKAGGIRVENQSCKSFSIAKGIQPGCSMDDVIAAFGVPNDRRTSDASDTSEYILDDNNQTCVKFYSYLNNNDYSEIDMKNYIITDEDITVTSTEVPEYLALYVKPEELGEDMTSGTVMIDGDLYSFPAPVSAFIENGWMITAAPSDLYSYGQDSISMARDGKSLKLDIINLALYQTIPENCAVYGASQLASSNTAPVVLPGNIGIGSSREEVERYVTDDFEYNENSGSYRLYRYGEKEISISIYVDNNENIINSVGMNCSVWHYE